ncbi:MAG TPA: hypothetical protein DDW49_11100 [Deltaproteobacteria bacterium]|nr:MAG: hypothetical protein A2048_02055 [Deltaproteobacteria bacterium GWA2_45_12]HBF13912.1 hypothetical protein [Deltaproteobacteria bacterium]
MSQTIGDIIAAFETRKFDPFAPEWNGDLTSEGPALPAPEGVAQLLPAEAEPRLPWTLEGIRDGRYVTFTERLQALLDGVDPKAGPLPDGERIVDLVLRDGTWADPNDVTAHSQRPAVPRFTQRRPSGLDASVLFEDLGDLPPLEGVESLTPGWPALAQPSSPAPTVHAASNTARGAHPHVGWRPTTAFHPFPGVARFASRLPVIRFR